MDRPMKLHSNASHHGNGVERSPREPHGSEAMARMRVAIIGTGISGLSILRLLARHHDVVAYEQHERCGGHSHTVQVEVNGRCHSVDTGFIVYNRRTYPNFVRLLDQLEVPSMPSDMSFGVSCARTGLEYSSTPAGLFAQRRNLVRPGFWRMLVDIRRFYSESTAMLEAGTDCGTLGDYLERRGFSRHFTETHLLPMAAAVWSTGATRVRDMPLHYLLRFFHNHGFLTFSGRPQWLTVAGGSRRYVDRIAEQHREQIRLRSKVIAVERTPDGVRVTTGEGAEIFDRVVIASHADQALRMLVHPSPAEQSILSAFPYETNEATLHTDAGVLPRRRAAWASWNYHIAPEPGGGASLTYLMNRLQRLDCEEPICVSLNLSDRINVSKIRAQYSYTHPVYTAESLRAQQRLDQISGSDRIYYCGAHWGFGFHEDGVNSALRVAAHFGIAP